MNLRRKRALSLGLGIGLRRKVKKTVTIVTPPTILDFSDPNNSQFVGQVI